MLKGAKYELAVNHSSPNALGLARGVLALLARVDDATEGWALAKVRADELAARVDELAEESANYMNMYDTQFERARAAEAEVARLTAELEKFRLHIADEARVIHELGGVNQALKGEVVRLTADAAEYTRMAESELARLRTALSGIADAENPGWNWQDAFGMLQRDARAALFGGAAE